MTDEEKIEHQKKVAKYAYDLLGVIDPECVLAGGAPRNWHLGKPAKDLDFWLNVPNKGMKHKTLLEKHFSRTPKFRGITKSDDEDYGSLPGIEALIDVPYQFENIQIVVLDDEWEPELYIDTFDFDLCKIMFDFKSTEIVPGYAFKNDMENKTLTYNISKLTKGQLLKAPARAKKMQELFPDHKMVIA